MSTGSPTPAPPTPSWWMRLLIAVGFLGVLAVDPLNAGSASSQRSEQALLRIASPFYRTSDRVTVILIDDAYLKQRRSGWPMRYSEQGLLLRRILAAEPAGVFVDLLYRHRHGRREAEGSDAEAQDEPLDLIAPLRSASASPIPLYFAALTQDPPGDDDCGDALRKPALNDARYIDAGSIDPQLHEALGIGPSPAPAAVRGPRLGVAAVGWTGCHGAYPLLLGASRATLTPAMALYHAMCQRGSAPASCRDATDLSAFVRPMIVRWGAYPPTVQRPFYAAGVCQPDADALRIGLLDKLLLSLRQFALGMVLELRNDKNVALALPCPAVAVVRADVILDASEADLRALLADKAVLVGASISGIPDWTQSAVHGQVPGVVLHAMALDNLLVQGAAYAKPMPSAAKRWIMVLVALTVALLAPRLVHREALFTEATRARVGLAAWAAFVVVLALHQQTGKALTLLGVGVIFDLMKPLETFRFLGFLAAMSLLAAAALALGWSPWNWIGLAFVAIATLESFKGYLRHSTARPFPHPDSQLWRAFCALRPALPSHRRLPS